MAARACRKRASASWRFWFARMSWSSKSFSRSSPKITHHFPRPTWSLGSAVFQSDDVVVLEGNGSLRAGGEGSAGGLTYFGPISQAVAKTVLNATRNGHVFF